MTCSQTGCSHNCNQGRLCDSKPRLNLPMTWLLVALFLALLGVVGPTLDMVDDHSDEYAQADDIQARQRFETAAQEICGQQAAWKETSPGVITCYLHTGRKSTVTAKVASK